MDRRPANGVRRGHRQRRLVRESGQLHQLPNEPRFGFVDKPTPVGMTPKRGWTAERDRRDFPGFFSSGLWFSGSGGPVRPGFATPGEVRSPNPAEQRVCVDEVKYQGELRQWPTMNFQGARL